MVLYSLDWTNIGFSFILLTVNLFRHPTLIEHGLYLIMSSAKVVCCTYLLTLFTNVSVATNSVDPDQTAPKGSTLFGQYFSRRQKQKGCVTVIPSIKIHLHFITEQ